MQRARFHQRLLGRQLLFGVLPVAIVIVAIVVVRNWREFDRLQAVAERELTLQAVIAADDIEAANRAAVLSAQRMAEAQMAGMFGDRPTSLAFARRVLESSPDLTGAYFGYEPDADGGDAASPGVLPPEAMDARGRFIPYWFVPKGAGGGVELEPLVDMATSSYYQGPRQAFAAGEPPAGIVTEPYVYQGKMIVEQVYPIIIDGDFKGIAGVDRALSDVSAYLRRLATRLDVHAILASSQDRFIAVAWEDGNEEATRRANDLRTKTLAETPFAPTLAPLLAEARAADGEGVVRVVTDPLLDERFYVAAATVPTGGWTVILHRPESDVLAPIVAQIRTGLIVAALGMLLIMAILVTSIVRVSRRVNMAVTVADRVAGGNLQEEIEPDDSADETGTLLRSLSTMTGNLNELVGGVKRASIQINSTATQLAATSRQQESVANEFGSSANEIAAAVEEISATGAELVQTMSDVSRVADETADLAVTGRDGLQGMETTMRGLDDATGAIAEKLAVINEKASRITGIVTTISKVAEQTNLLSVNAAIEAEKAGEFGVGFLVVAREIRRLADQSAGATLDIEQMVQEMQSAVSAGVMEMDRFSDHVRRSVDEVALVAERLTAIIEQVGASTGAFARVNEGMQSQAEGADQIALAMGHLTEGAARTSAAIREYADAADGLKEAIGSLKSSISIFHLKA